MKILLIHEANGEPGQGGGGAEAMRADLIQALTQAGHEIEWLHTPALEEAVERFKPTFIHISTIHNFIGIELAAKVQALSIPHAWFIMDYWPWCANRSLMKQSLQHAGDEPCSAVEGICDLQCEDGRAPGFVLETVNKSPVVALSEGAADIYRRNRLRVDAIFPLGIDTELFKPDYSQRTPEVSIYTSMAWGAHPNKGLHIIARAIEGTAYNVQVISGRPRSEVAQHLKKAHIYIFPSTFQETFGLGLTEGMASGCACIASDVAGVRSQIEDGLNGLLFPNRDHLALWNCILRLVQDTPYRERLGKAAREKAEGDFTLEKMAERYEALVSSLRPKPQDVVVKVNTLTLGATT